MDKSVRLEQLINYYSAGNKTNFAKKLGITAQCLYSWMSRNTLDYDVIFAKCEDLSAKWLLTGEGEMLDLEKKNTEEEFNFIKECLDRIERLTAENAVLKYRFKKKENPPATFPEE